MTATHGSSYGHRNFARFRNADCRVFSCIQQDQCKSENFLCDCFAALFYGRVFSEKELAFSVRRIPGRPTNKAKTHRKDSKSSASALPCRRLCCGKSLCFCEAKFAECHLHEYHCNVNKLLRLLHGGCFFVRNFSIVLDSVYEHKCTRCNSILSPNALFFSSVA